MADYVTRTGTTPVSHHWVANLWREHGLKPQKQGTFKLSKDPAFADKVADARTDSDLAAKVLRVTPALFGADGDRRYLVVFVTPAELRGRCGYPVARTDRDDHERHIGVATEELRTPADAVRGAVDVGLTRFAQPSVAHGHAIAFEHALQGRGTAVHRGGLHDLRHEPAPLRARGGRRHHCGESCAVCAGSSDLPISFCHQVAISADVDLVAAGEQAVPTDELDAHVAERLVVERDRLAAAAPEQRPAALEDEIEAAPERR